MDASDTLGQLVRSLYRAAFEPDSWPETLRLLGAAGGGLRTYMVSRDRSRPDAAPGSSHDFDESHMDAYMRHYGRLDPWAARARDSQRKVQVLRHAAISRDSVRGTPFYEEWLKPQGDHTSGGEIVVPIGSRRVIVLGGDIPYRDHDRLDDDWARLLNFIAPVVRHAAGLSSEMADLRLSSGIGESTPRDAALFLLGPSGVILHANERGADMLAEGSVVRLAAAGRLALQAETAQAIANHVLAASGTSRLAAGQRLDRAGLPEGLAGHVVPVSTEAGLTGLAGTMAWSVTEAAAAVMVLKGQPRTETLRDRLRRAFSMTEAEAAVAEGIHAGLTLNDIALLRGVTINTIRNQTKLALSKAGVHRQADLVRVVDRLT